MQEVMMMSVITTTPATQQHWCQWGTRNSTCTWALSVFHENLYQLYLIIMSCYWRG